VPAKSRGRDEPRTPSAAQTAETRILVTGSRGLLGSALVPHLRACGNFVLGHSRGREADIYGDLTDARQVSSALDEAAPDVVVNLAALTDVDECERKPQLAYLANVRIVENLARWIRANGSRTYLVQVSTDQVYDGPGPHPKTTSPSETTMDSRSTPVSSQ
jgi:dTDP-4-dehydrorhamnose reductase